MKFHVLQCFLLSFIPFFIFTSCDSEDGSWEPYLSSYSTERINKDIVNLSMNDAASVALLSRKEQKSIATRSENLSVKSIFPIRNHSEDIIMYAVNYEENQGYTVVSASKFFSPIIVDVNKGEFLPINTDSPVSFLYDEYESEIEHNKTLPIDSLYLIQKEWSRFEKAADFSSHYRSTRLNEIDQIVVDSLSAWESKGFIVYPLYAGCPEDLPTSVFNSFCASAEANCNPNYDYMNYSFILYDKSSSSESIGPLITTEWRQNQPYNLSVPSGNVLGCSTIAVAQVLNYFEWPPIYNWDNFPDRLSSNINYVTSLSDFLYEIGQNLGINYYSSPGANIEDVCDSLINMGYFAICRNPHASNYVVSSLRDRSPVIMEGVKYYSDLQVYGGSHIWLCDGFSHGPTQESYVLKTLSLSLPLEFVETGASYSYSVPYNYMFSMKFRSEVGSGDYDGWYLDSSLPSDVNYDHLRIDITDINPDY